MLAFRAGNSCLRRSDRLTFFVISRFSGQALRKQETHFHIDARKVNVQFVMLILLNVENYPKSKLNQTAE